MKDFQFEFRWSRLKDISGGDFICGTELGKLRSSFSGPAIYRWVIEFSGQSLKVYIGETEELGRRLYQYLNPGSTQHSNLRLREEFLLAKAQGQEVFLERLEFEPFTLNGVRVSVEELNRKYIRRLLEALICLQLNEGVISLNR